MHIRIETKTLNDALTLVSPAAARSAIIPALLAARFRLIQEEAGDPARTLEICCTNLDARLSVRVPCEVVDPALGQALLPMATLMPLAKLLRDESIDILVTDPTRAILRTLDAEYELMTPHAEDFPSDIGVRVAEEPEKAPIRMSVEMPARDLVRALNATRYAIAGSKEIRYVLQSLLFSFQEDKLELVAIDGHRLARATIGMQDSLGLDHPAEYLVPEVAVDLLRHMLTAGKPAHPVRLIFEGGCITATCMDHAGRASIEMKSKLMDAQYPNYRPLIDINPETVLEIRRADLMNAIRRVSLLACDPSAFGLTVHLGPAITIEAADRSIGRAHEKVTAASFEGKPQSFRVNQEYVLQYLEASQDDVVRLVVQNNRSPLHFHDQMGHECFIMPMIMLDSLVSQKTSSPLQPTEPASSEPRMRLL